MSLTISSNPPPPKSARKPTVRIAVDGTEGKTIAFVESSHALPLVSIAITLRSGSAYDPPGREGLSRLCARMLRRGCEGMVAERIEEAIDRLGAELSVDVSSSSVALHAQVIRRSLEPFIDLLARLIGSPTFPADEFARLQRETVAEIIEARDNDRSLAQSAFRRALFEGHPYGRRSTTKTIEAATQEEAKALYGKHFVRGNAVLGFAGAISAEEAAKFGAKLAQSLAPGSAMPDPVPEPAARPGRRLVFVDKPERTQTQILIGSLGTSPHDGDHVALGVACAIFGGTFTSRLMQEVRSKRGWSYGAYARLAVDRHRQGFSMWTFPSATDAAACIELELGMLDTFVKEGVTPKETTFIKKYLTRSHAFEIDTAPKRLHQAIDVEVLGLPSDYHTAYLDKVEKVTEADANVAVRARLSAENTFVAVVGTASDIRPAVQKVLGKLEADVVVPFDAE
jgi:zinc protease